MDINLSVNSNKTFSFEQSVLQQFVRAFLFCQVVWRSNCLKFKTGWPKLMSMGFSHLIFARRLWAIHCINFNAVFTNVQLASQAFYLCVVLPWKVSFYLSKLILKTRNSIVFWLSPTTSPVFLHLFPKLFKILSWNLAQA